MNGVIRKATLLVVLGLAAAVSVATAGVPSPANSTLPAYVDLVGCNGTGVVDPRGSFTVTVRDIGNFPVAGQLVSVAFNTDVRIYNAFPGFVSCQCAEATTGVDGVATFAAIPGAGKSTGNVSGFTGASAATFYAGSCGSLVLGTAHVATFDLDGGVTSPGVGISDLSSWIADYNARGVAPTKHRSDYNHGGAVDIGDLSSWVTVYNSLASKFSCGTLCP